MVVMGRLLVVLVLVPVLVPVEGYGAGARSG
jgi:hypothetical protein